MRKLLAVALCLWSFGALAQAITGGGSNGGTPGGTAGGSLAGTYPNPTLATQGANTGLANVTASTAAPTAAALPSCVDTGGNHLNYTNGTGFSCGTSAGAAGAMTLISTQTANNSATFVAWTGLGSTYKQLLLTCQSLVPATTNNTMFVQFGEGGTPTWETSGYLSRATTVANDGTAELSTGTSGISVTGGSISGTNGVHLAAWIADPASAIFKTVHGTTGGTLNGDSFAVGGPFFGIYSADSNAITAVRVITNTGNLKSGQCSLYGLSS